MKNLLQFLKSQKLLVLATKDGDGLWVANVYYGIGDDFKIYFVSRENTKHSSHILNDPQIAFSIAWFDNGNHKNRKAVQGLGVCRPANTEEEIVRGVKLHNENFPEFAERITVGWIRDKEVGSDVWTIEPSYMKYWDDELYGNDGTQEFTFATVK